MTTALAHPFDDTRVFRLYEPHELKNDRYPFAWERLEDPAHSRVLDLADMVLPGGVKDVVRAVAGGRCQRCRHPYRPGCGSWAPKDDTLRPPSARNMTGLPTDVQLMFHACELLGSADEFRTVPDRDRAEREDLWSPCDPACTHGGPFRSRVQAFGAARPRGWTVYGPGAQDAGERVRKGMETEAAWRILTVHHLNERKFDLRWWNLAALCQRCHLQIQRKVTMEVPWPWEHSTWFRPHAAAWYALKFLGEHLTYTQTLARLDELLELGLEHEATERMAL